MLAIDLTMRLMAYSVDNSALMIIYDRVPETLVLLPMVSLLLLGMVVSSVVLFRGIVRFKDEERKRLLLENRVADVYQQIEDLQDIYGDMRGLRHDLRAHIASITSYVRNHQEGEDKELESYLGGMERTIARLSHQFPMFVDKADGGSVMDAAKKTFHIIICQKMGNIFRTSPDDFPGKGEFFGRFRVPQVPDDAHELEGLGAGALPGG